MRIKCLGGFREVGRSGVLIEDKEKILIDYGLEVETGKVPIKPGIIDYALMTHPHLDHIGMAPALYRDFVCPIFGTISTFDQGYLLLKDALKIARIKREIARFSANNIKTMARNEVDVTFGQNFDLGTKTCTVFNAGHVPGSVSYLVEGKKSVLYTGDFNTKTTRLVRGADIRCRGIDVMMTESTYAFKEHPPRKEVEEDFLDTVKATVENEAIALVPVFAVGRSQEILLILEELNKKYPIYLDGMAKDATQIALRYPEFLEDHKALKKAMNKVIPVYTNKDRKMAVSHPCIIVTTGGMLSGGPIGWYIKKLYNRSDCSINLTGFCVESTPGRVLMDTGKFVNEEVNLKLKMGINHFDFSAHIGREDLFSIIKRVSPEKVVCMHGDNCEKFAEELKREHGFDAVAPKNGDILNV